VRAVRGGSGSRWIRAISASSRRRGRRSRRLAPNGAYVQRIRDGNSVEVQGSSSALPTLFPQHGPGRRHTRRIVLEDRQREIVDRHPKLFLRGLIQSDGCRVTNRVGGGRYAYPRYFFTQVSTAIMELFCRACRQLGIEYTLNRPASLSIARVASVACVDEFVGPRSEPLPCSPGRAVGMCLQSR
jgi:hypothetical protein